jgi:hypothetical protein
VVLSTTTAVTMLSRCCVPSVGTRSASMRLRRCGAVAASAACSAASAVAAIGNVTRSAAVAASAFTAEAMPAPAVAIAPAAPGAHAKEDAVVEISRPVITHGRALVWCVTVVAVCTTRLNADVNGKLRLCCRRQGQPHEQCGATEENFESAHVTPL